MKPKQTRALQYAVVLLFVTVVLYKAFNDGVFTTIRARKYPERIWKGGCNGPNSTDGLHLLQEFFLINSNIYKERMHLGLESEAILDKRQDEIDSCLQRNLMHRCTASITIFHDDPNVPEYISRFDLINKEKLIFVQTKYEST